MTLTFTVEVECPVCGERVSLPAVDVDTSKTPNGVVVHLSPDMAVLEEHLRFWHQ